MSFQFKAKTTLFYTEQRLFQAALSGCTLHILQLTRSIFKPGAISLQSTCLHFTRVSRFRPSKPDAGTHSSFNVSEHGLKII